MDAPKLSRRIPSLSELSDKMFLSVKERARQIANGQLTAAPQASQIVEPPPKVAPPKTSTFPKVTLKPTAAKPPSPKAASAKPTSPKTAAPKPAPAKALSSKPAPTRTATQIGAFPDAALPTPKLSRSKTEPPRSPKSSKPEASKTKKSSSSSKDKDTPSRPKPSRAESSKSVSKTSTPSKTKSSKSVPSTPIRSSFFSRIRDASTSSSSSESSTDDEAPKSAPSDEITELKAACLKQVSGVTGLGGKNLAIVCRQTSKKGWYAALKDTSSDKYLKMWMNREKTFATQVEALQAYLVFAKKMKEGLKMFPAGTKK